MLGRGEDNTHVDNRSKDDASHLQVGSRPAHRTPAEGINIGASPALAALSPSGTASSPSTTTTTMTRTGGVSSSAIPAPTYLPQDRTKKSHARKQPHGHVPRPRNAFILFRCDFVRQRKVPADVENDHRNLSRIAGTVWRQMTAKEKRPWIDMAEREKREHSMAYPGYKYKPIGAQPIVSLHRRKRKASYLKQQHRAKPSVVAIERRSDFLAQKAQDFLPAFEAPPLPAQNHPSQVPQVSPRPMIAKTAWGFPTLVNTGMPGRQGSDYSPSLNTTLPCNPSSAWNSSNADGPKQDFELGASKVKANFDPFSQTDMSYLSLRRPSSCPPGEERITTAAMSLPAAFNLSQQGMIDSPVGGLSCLLETRDDLLSARRPSRINVVYKSSPTGSIFPSNAAAASSSSMSYTFVHELGRNTRPVLTGGAYAIQPPSEVPGWDAAPSSPRRWDWNTDVATGGPDDGKNSIGKLCELFLSASDCHFCDMPPPPPTFTNPFTTELRSPDHSTHTNNVGPTEFLGHGTPFQFTGISPLDQAPDVLPRAQMDESNAGSNGFILPSPMSDYTHRDDYPYRADHLHNFSSANVGADDHIFEGVTPHYTPISVASSLPPLPYSFPANAEGETGVLKANKDDVSAQLAQRFPRKSLDGDTFRHGREVESHGSSSPHDGGA